MSHFRIEHIPRPNWPFWAACYVVGFPGGVLVTWGRHRLSGLWSRLEKRQRVLLNCLAVAALWFWLSLVYDKRSDRFLDATAITIIVLHLWGGYAVFSRVIDRVWPRIRKRRHHSKPAQSHSPTRLAQKTESLPV